MDSARGPLRQCLVPFIRRYGLLLVPILAFTFWSIIILGLLLSWTASDGARRYYDSESAVIYISDSGAEHRILFIIGATMTSVFYTLTLLLERLVTIRIPNQITPRKAMICSSIAIGFAFISSLALFLLSIFDTFKYRTFHWSLTMTFVGCVSAGSVLQTMSMYALKNYNPKVTILKKQALCKLIIMCTGAFLGVGFCATYGLCRGLNTTPQCDTITSVSAAFEWAIAVTLDVFLLTLIHDMWLSLKARYETPVIEHQDGQQDSEFHVEFETDKEYAT